MHATRNSQFVELVTRGSVGRVRRDWPEDFKAEMAARSMMPGVNASALAREIGISPSQLFGWRRYCRDHGLVETVCDVSARRAEEKGSIEIEINGAVVRCTGSVDERALTLGAIAEFERALISERTKAGLEAARLRGRKGGRPRKAHAP